MPLFFNLYVCPQENNSHPVRQKKTTTLNIPTNKALCETVQVFHQNETHMGCILHTHVNEKKTSSHLDIMYENV